MRVACSYLKNSVLAFVHASASQVTWGRSLEFCGDISENLLDASHYRSLLYAPQERRLLVISNRQGPNITTHSATCSRSTDVGNPSVRLIALLQWESSHKLVCYQSVGPIIFIHKTRRHIYYRFWSSSVLIDVISLGNEYLLGDNFSCHH